MTAPGFQARPQMLAATTSSDSVGMWFERTVAVAQREQSGGEPFPPAGLDRAV